MESTITLIVYLFNGVILTNYIKPNNKKQVWFYSIGLSFSFLLATIIIYSSLSAYSIGFVFGNSIIAAIITTIVIFYRLNRKLRNLPTSKFPIILMAVLLIGSIISGINFLLKRGIERNMQTMTFEQNKETGKLELVDWNKIDTVKYSKVVYQDVTFFCPKSTLWEGEEIEKGTAFQVNCIDNSAMTNEFKVQWYNLIISPLEIIQTYKKELLKNSITSTDTKKSKFRTYDSYTFDYSLDKESTSTLITFNIFDKTFVLINTKSNNFKGDGFDIIAKTLSVQ